MNDEPWKKIQIKREASARGIVRRAEGTRTGGARDVIAKIEKGREGGERWRERLSWLLSGGGSTEVAEKGERERSSAWGERGHERIH